MIVIIIGFGFEWGIRMLVGTWNVGGKPPNEGLNLRDWLNSSTPIDIYVLGYSLSLSRLYIVLENVSFLFVEIYVCFSF